MLQLLEMLQTAVQLPAALPQIKSIVFQSCNAYLPGTMLQVEAPESRAKFSPEAFAKQYNLGDPLALLFFKAHHQESLNADQDSLAQTL